MDEFELISHYFKQHALKNPFVKFGIGDDCACLTIPKDMDLLVSVDTLVSGVHFAKDCDPYAIAYKAVMVNISDCAAMAAKPFAILLSLTLPSNDKSWLDRFHLGLKDALGKYKIALIGGDLTYGPLALSVTIQALTPNNKAVFRHGAKTCDEIYVTGYLGLAAFVVENLAKYKNSSYCKAMEKALNFPTPRLDWLKILQNYATAAIDISDGLLLDLNHICLASKKGAMLQLDDVPINPLLVSLTQKNEALNFALQGGDDYELCFTVPKQRQAEFLLAANKRGLTSYKIGIIQETEGLYSLNESRQYVQLKAKGYRHFKDSK